MKQEEGRVSPVDYPTIERLIDDTKSAHLLQEKNEDGAGPPNQKVLPKED
jgi:hypothetical protein